MPPVEPPSYKRQFGLSISISIQGCCTISLQGRERATGLFNEAKCNFETLSKCQKCNAKPNG